MAQVDTSIYQNMLRPVKSVQEYDQEAQQAEGNKLGLLLQRGQVDAQQRGVAEDSNFRNLLSSGADEKALMAASPTKAMALMKGRAEIGKEQAQTGLYGAQTKKAEADAGKTSWEAREAKRKTALADIAALDSPATAIQSLQAHFQAGDLDEQKYQSVLATIPQNPADFPAWQVKMLRSIMSAENQMLDERKRADQAETARNNKAQNGIAAGQLGVAQGQLGVARQRLATEQSAPKGQYDAERGVLIDPRTGQAKPVTMGGQPLAPKAKSGPMSVTLQKELIESDDNVQQSASAIAALRKAKTINDKAYSGYGASGRAKLMSNVYETDGANATIELDNLIGQQALSSMKSIFGGNPTEGERAILLDLQASSSKTPAQRTAILDRAIKAAETRAKFAQSKAQSIRNGKYLSEGAPVPDADGALSGADKQALDWANANANDPRAKQIKQRLGM